MITLPHLSNAFLRLTMLIGGVCTDASETSACEAVDVIELNCLTPPISMTVNVRAFVRACVCERASMHLKYYSARVPPAHLFSACSTCSAWLVFGFVSPCRQSFKDMHPCVSRSPLLDPLRVVQRCK